MRGGRPTLDELPTFHRVPLRVMGQRAVMRPREAVTWHDPRGRIRFTHSKGLRGVGPLRGESNEARCTAFQHGAPDGDGHRASRQPRGARVRVAGPHSPAATANAVTRRCGKSLGNGIPMDESYDHEPADQKFQGME